VLKENNSFFLYLKILRSMERKLSNWRKPMPKKLQKLQKHHQEEEEKSRVRNILQWKILDLLMKQRQIKENLLSKKMLILFLH
jgi:hypothetical protein